MSTPHEQLPEREQILKEKLSEAELHKLLERLQAHDQNEAGMPTIGAVSEATGADPMLIHRLLREVRHQPPQVFEPMVRDEVAVQKSSGTKATVAVVVALVVAVLLAFFLVAGMFMIGGVKVEEAPRIEQPQKTSAAPVAPVHDGALR